MPPGERFKNWIEGLGESWKLRLHGWMSSWLEWGIESLLDVIGKRAAPSLRPFVDRLEATGLVPPELQPLLAEIKEPTGEIGAMFAQSAGGALIGGAIGRILDSMLNPLAYIVAQDTQNALLSQSQYLALWLRGELSDKDLKDNMAFMNIAGGYTELLKELTQLRLDPLSVITAWRRDPEKYNALFDDLKDQGWSPERIAALKFVTEIRPSPQEAISMMAHEAFEEGMVAKYGLDDEFENLDFDYLATIGITEETARYHWRGHWQHASFNQVVEMYRRKLITVEDFSEWFRVVEIPPFWRDNLIEVSHAWPTRVDVRRWWDMRTIDEAELRRLYEGMGYHGVNLDNYILWTKVYVAFPDLMARWQKGWITLDDVRGELIGLGMPLARVEEMIQTKIEPEKEERVSGERDLTKTDIIKGVKTGVISWEEGIELLQDIGYDEDEADYILTINIEAMTGSPANFAEFKAITRKHQIAVGKGGKPMPEELKAAAVEVVRLTKEVAALKEAAAVEEKTLIAEEVLPATATERLTELEVSLHRAEAELWRVKTDYDALLAEWRHGG